MISKIFLTLGSLILLTGCGLDRVKREPPPQIITKWRTYDCGVPPARDHISFRVPKFVITEGLFTLTTDQYAVLGESMQDIIKASGQLVETIRFYERCIAAANVDRETTNE